MVGEDFRCGYKGYFCVSEIQQFCEKKSLTLQVCIDVILEDATIYSYACRTGLGNPKTDKEGYVYIKDLKIGGYRILIRGAYNE